LPTGRDNVLVSLLQPTCRLPIKEADDKEPLTGGAVYFAPADYHLLVEDAGSLALSTDEAVNYSRPSIDVLFESAADIFGDGLLGIVLTGANHDGAAGLRAVVDAGGQAIVEDPAGAYASAMPMAALAACPEASVMSLDALVTYLSRLETA
jgi:two-component system chemotaxis response regulator CheB